MIRRCTLISRTERKLQMGVKTHLDAWFAEAEKPAGKNSAELKQQFRSASIVSAERVVSISKGND